MELTPQQKDRVAAYVPAFKDCLNSPDYEKRRDRRELYSQILSPSGLERMTELELGQLVSSLWSYRGWGNKGYIVEKLIQDNGLEKLRSALHGLLWGTGTIADRYNHFRTTIKWLGVSSITEISELHASY